MNRSIYQSVRRTLTSRPAWLVLGGLIIALLAVGSNHPKVPSAAERLNNLEAIIKCPGCATASLAQSETVSANELKVTITQWIHEGVNDQTIERRVVADYGTDELLSQSNPLLWVVPTIVVGLSVVVLGTYLLRRRATNTRVTEADEALVAELLGYETRQR